ncbi:MAG: hypothetical protein LBI38_07270 [Oscillospiraceae bacterium]|jgi:D-alanine--D-alanine ligase|nr:hypothetical protein [Oscillospiraceae bacterium]
MLKILLLCGGKGKERDISLNSARSVYDHIKGLRAVSPTVVFLDANGRRYLIDEGYLYSNTSDDFRFLLKSVPPMSGADFGERLSDCDFVFPLIHGVGGEDGEIQRALESSGVKFIGSPSNACLKMYNKRNASEKILDARGMRNIPKIFVSGETDNFENAVAEFAASHGKVCVKPVEGGSSFGVRLPDTERGAVDAAKELTEEYGEIVVEKRCAGKEFTVIVLENRGRPVALIPTEIEIADGGAFSRRRKYMPTTEVRYHCPARFSGGVIGAIRSKAEELFEFAGARDFLRIDGWVLEGGDIYFSDFNPISGMEQNSFVFQQAAEVGFTHGALLEYILRNACERHNAAYGEAKPPATVKRAVNVLLGGTTSERQVSLLSGVNVWMKLARSEKYSPVPYILTEDGANNKKVCEIPYSLALLHTTEEIVDRIDNGSRDAGLIAEIRDRLGLPRTELKDKARWVPLERFIEDAKDGGAYVFIGLHGGFGENGGIQALLDEKGVDYNGSGAGASALCMDKYETGIKVTELGLPLLRACKKALGGLDVTWERLAEELGEPIIAKPNGDGCSTGVVKLRGGGELSEYLKFCGKGEDIPKRLFGNRQIIAMPQNCEKILFEEYIRTDPIFARNGEVVYNRETGWVEITVGVLEKRGRFHAFNPSVSIAENDILSVEEKFQGGVGINLTPPPQNVIPDALKDRIRYFAERVAEKCEVGDYCRVDMFANNQTGEVIVIEVNTLPGLSPSTVLFQQAAKEDPPLSPLELLERIIDR